MRIDAAPVTDLASLVHNGLATRSEWQEAGASQRMFTDGRLVRVARGLYAVPPLADEPQDMLHAVAARCPSDAVIGGWLAAQTQDVRDAGPTMLSPEPQPILIYLGRDEHKEPPGFDVLRVDLAPEEIMTFKGLRMTNPARTAYDMSRRSRYLDRSVAILDCFTSELSPNPVSTGDIAGMIKAHPKHRGNPLLRRALPLLSSRSRSMPESKIRARWVSELGVSTTALLVNVKFQHGRRWFELDLVDLESGLVIEYDGTHHADRLQRSRDAAKDRAVTAAGLAMLRVNSPELSLNAIAFAQLGEERRRYARSIGAPQAAARLVQDGLLVEQPLTNYATRGGFPLDN